MLLQAITESLEHLRPFMPWAMHEPSTLEEKMELLRRFRSEFDSGKDYVFGIFNKDETELIGSTGLHTRIGKNAREIGYWISKKYAHQGLATEAVQALIQVAFEIEAIDRIEIHCAPDNLFSQKIPHKLGFTHEATLKNRALDSQGNPRDTMIWSLFKEDYKAQVKPSISIRAFDACGKLI
jgi:hypothetical protein